MRAARRYQHCIQRLSRIEGHGMREWMLASLFTRFEMFQRMYIKRVCHHVWLAETDGSAYYSRRFLGIELKSTSKTNH
jgi:hypothetical protein